jgi:hypothetical protein
MANAFIKDYESLNEIQKNHIQNINQKAQELLDAIYASDENGYPNNAIDRSRVKLEECIMWAVKAIT